MESLGSCIEHEEDFYEDFGVGHSLFFYSNLNSALDSDLLKRSYRNRNDKLVVHMTRRTAHEEMRRLGIRVDQFLSI
jgi:hypothetical protein